MKGAIVDAVTAGCRKCICDQFIDTVLTAGFVESLIKLLLFLFSPLFNNS